MQKAKHKKSWVHAGFSEDLAFSSLRVTRVLEHLAQTRGLPEEIHVDHGPEFVCRSVRSWCEEELPYDYTS